MSYFRNTQVGSVVHYVQEDRCVPAIVESTTLFDEVVQGDAAKWPVSLVVFTVPAIPAPRDALFEDNDHGRNSPTDGTWHRKEGCTS